MYFRYIFSGMWRTYNLGMWKEYNPNPFEQRTGDCSVRALTKALGMDWDSVFALTAEKGFEQKRVQSTDSVWGAVLRNHGFKRESIPDSCPDCYTAEDFCRDHPKGIYVLGFGGHVATVVDGILYDAWNSSYEIPQFVWYRKE